ncbi:hypothetical protein HDA32_001303 [Spinactinospora alkalitolerans]|uniref:DUF3291 domain-containing protein n=1 Tax=Spinactinospora alkalitolerans TaxID=687207 RepID=A0A852TTV9_9ACTN|nr:DUF3291 domain-containing protein [Spinactinospora alkalitolerans]NYE46183.1 hypothetical protein [Spinactinospora alkalitolerans]
MSSSTPTLSAVAPPAADLSRPRPAAAAGSPVPPVPVLAQAHAILLPADAGEHGAEVAELAAALRARAAGHPGHVAVVEAGDAGTPEVSLWRSLADLRDFAYRSRDDLLAWRRRTGLPVATERALWWIGDGRRPSASEARARLADLREHGPTPRAFTLRSPVPPGSARG